MSKWIEEDVIKNSTISAEVESAFRTLITNSVLTPIVFKGVDGEVEYLRIEDRIYVLKFTVIPEQEQ